MITLSCALHLNGIRLYHRKDFLRLIVIYTAENFYTVVARSSAYGLKRQGPRIDLWEISLVTSTFTFGQCSRTNWLLPNK